jgi:DNA-binding SARP family transcriptional activator
MTSSPTTHLKLWLLGGFEAQRFGQTVDGFTYAKMRALLAYLAVENMRTHSRDTLADLFWENCDAVDGRGNLRRTLSNLRRVLERPGSSPLFAVSKNTIRFLPYCWVDSVYFQDQASVALGAATIDGAYMESVAASYTGEFLSNLTVSDSPGFEEWLTMQRGKLRRLALALQDAACRAYEQAGDGQRAIRCAARFAELDPLNEEVCRRVLRLHHKFGQPSAAILHYQNFCQLLETDLGVAPSAETQKLALDISAQAVHQPSSQPRSERYQVSALYCDYQLSSGVDHEHAMTLVAQTRAHALAILERLQAYVVVTQHSGLLAYFGYPMVNEDAARNAVQAGLLLATHSMGGLHWRAGVHTGLVIAKGERPDSVGILTDTVISLARSAAANELVISQQAFRLVNGYFECQRLRTQMEVDHRDALTLYKVLRDTGAHSRLDAAKQSGATLTPLVGREDEIELLMSWWRMSVQGQRQCALILGEPGIGKSRLLLALKSRLQTARHYVWELRCRAQFSETALYPFATLIETLLVLDATQSPAVKFVRLARLVERVYPAMAASAVPLLAQLLSLPLAEHYQPIQQGATAKHIEATTSVLLALLPMLSQRQPVLLVWEDMQWADPSTLTLLARYMALQQDEPLLMLLSARPGFRPPQGLPMGNTLALGPLDDRHVRAMIAALQSEMDEAVVARIAARTDGVPLYVEEMVKMGFVGKVMRVPYSLRDMLALRMAQMGSAKYTAQLASVLGCEFTLEMLQTLFAPSRHRFEKELSALVEQGVLVQNGVGAFAFKQTLMRNALYQCQTKVDRQAMHRSVAQCLLADFKPLAQAQPELVAWHLSAGGLPQESIDLWVKTGDLAISRSALADAYACFMHGVQLLPALPPNAAREQLASALCRRLGKALVILNGFGPSEFARAYRMAQRLVSTSVSCGGYQVGEFD